MYRESLVVTAKKAKKGRFPKGNGMQKFLPQAQFFFMITLTLYGPNTGKGNWEDTGSTGIYVVRVLSWLGQTQQKES